MLRTDLMRRTYVQWTIVPRSEVLKRCVRVYADRDVHLTAVSVLIIADWLQTLSAI